MLLQFFLQHILALAEDTEGAKGTTREKTRMAKTSFKILERIFMFSEYSHAENNVNPRQIVLKIQTPYPYPEKDPIPPFFHCLFLAKNL